MSLRRISPNTTAGIEEIGTLTRKAPAETKAWKKYQSKPSNTSHGKHHSRQVWKAL